MATVATLFSSSYEENMATFNVTVRAYKDSCRPSSRWVVNVYDPRKKGSQKRSRFFFPTKEIANAEALAKRVQFQNEGLQGLDLSPRQKLEAWDAYNRLSSFQVSLSTVVDYFVENHKHRSKTIIELVSDYKAHCIRIGRSERTLDNQESFFTRFLTENTSKTLASDFSRHDIEEWLHSLKAGTETFNTYRGILHSLFSFAVKREHILKNPVSDIELLRSKKEKVCIFTPEQMYALLSAAKKAGDEDVLAYLAIGAFSGLRPDSEIARLRWENIDFHVTTESGENFGLIDVSAENKTAQQRYVKILPSLAAVLASIHQRKGLVMRPNFRRRFRRIRKASGVEWGHDILRHSYASYHLAHYEDTAALQLQMGHADMDMIFGNYRQRVKKSEAEKWWLLPSKP